MTAPVLGACAAVAFTFPLAGLTALVYQFPVPIVGMVRGLEGVFPPMFGLTIYAMLGWVAAPLMLGAVGGLIAQHRVALSRKDATRMTVLLAGIAAFACTTTLATIDKVIGPW